MNEKTLMMVAERGHVKQLSESRRASRDPKPRLLHEILLEPPEELFDDTVEEQVTLRYYGAMTGPSHRP